MTTLTEAARAELRRKLDVICNTLQYGCNGQWGLETIGPIREAIAALAASEVQAGPVAWRQHAEQRIRSWRQRTMNRSGDMLSLDDFMSAESIDDLVDFVCDEWVHPPAPEQPAPALASAPRVPQWQPIETAPRDGTAVLCFRLLHGQPDIATASWKDYAEAFGGPGWTYANGRNAPTHWIPFPAAPQPEGDTP
jgi:hypothetical protein